MTHHWISRLNLGNKPLDMLLLHRKNKQTNKKNSKTGAVLCICPQVAC